LAAPRIALPEFSMFLQHSSCGFRSLKSFSLGRQHVNIIRGWISTPRIIFFRPAVPLYYSRLDFDPLIQFLRARSAYTLFEDRISVPRIVLFTPAAPLHQPRWPSIQQFDDFRHAAPLHYSRVDSQPIEFVFLGQQRHYYYLLMGISPPICLLQANSSVDSFFSNLIFCH
jgi:hypothetical protein